MGSHSAAECTESTIYLKKKTLRMNNTSQVGLCMQREQAILYSTVQYFSQQGDSKFRIIIDLVNVKVKYFKVTAEICCGVFKVHKISFIDEISHAMITSQVVLMEAAGNSFISVPHR